MEWNIRFNITERNEAIVLSQRNRTAQERNGNSRSTAWDTNGNFYWRLLYMYLVTSDEHVRLQCDIVFGGE